jgi:hypothetical protein
MKLFSERLRRGLTFAQLKEGKRVNFEPREAEKGPRAAKATRGPSAPSRGQMGVENGA